MGDYEHVSRQKVSFRLILILGAVTVIGPLSIDMHLPALALTPAGTPRSPAGGRMRSS
jgi:hypothetical protein